VAITAYSPLARGGEEVHMKLGEKVDLFTNKTLLEIAYSKKKTVG